MKNLFICVLLFVFLSFVARAQFFHRLNQDAMPGYSYFWTVDTTHFVNKLTMDLSIAEYFDDNIYYSTQENEISAWVTSISPKVEYKRESDRMFFHTAYRGVGDLYHGINSNNQLYRDIPGRNMFSNFLNLEAGVKLSDHFLFRVKNDLDNTNRPDFLQLDEIVYGRFIQNNFRSELLYRTTERFELSFGYGNSYVDYYRSDDSPYENFIDSRANMATFGAIYHADSFTTLSFNYYFARRTFPSNPVMAYKDHVVTFSLKKQLSQQWNIYFEIGGQDRKLDTEQLWNSGFNLYAKAYITVNRENSKIQIFVGRERSLSPNYSEDFYTDTYVKGRWNWNFSEKNSLNIEGGYRFNDFELFPASFTVPTTELRQDNYGWLSFAYDRRLRERMFLEVSYRYMTRASNNDFFDFNKNVFTLAFRYLIR